jgi:hypothetical protein
MMYKAVDEDLLMSYLRFFGSGNAIHLRND